MIIILLYFNWYANLSALYDPTLSNWIWGSVTWYNKFNLNHCYTNIAIICYSKSTLFLEKFVNFQSFTFFFLSLSFVFHSHSGQRIKKKKFSRTPSHMNNPRVNQYMIIKYLGDQLT